MKNIENFEIQYLGIDLRAYGTFYPAIKKNDLSPDEPAEFMMSELIHKDENIIDLLDYRTCIDIESIVVNKLEDDK